MSTPQHPRRKRMPVVTVVVTLVLMMLGQGLAVARQSSETPSRLAPAELRAAVLAAHDRIDSLYLEYRCDYPPEFSAPEGAAIYRIIGCQRSGEFYLSSGKGHARLDWHNDPRWHRCYVSGGEWYWEYVVWRAYSKGTISPEDTLPESAKYELFFRASGIWPFEKRATPRFGPTPCALRDVVNDSRYELRTDLEAVDGKLCHVLEAPTDALWIDVTRACAVLVRQLRDPDGGALTSRFELGDYREVADGVWIPGLIRSIQYAPASGDREPKKVVDSLTRITVARVNDIANEIFEFEPPPGAFWLDPPGKNAGIQSHPRGQDHLDCLTRWVFDSGLASETGRHNRVMATVGFAIGFCAGLVAAYGRKARRSQSRGRAEGVKENEGAIHAAVTTSNPGN